MTATPPGRALGIDFGTKRVGYAVSDELGWVAEPLEVWIRRTLAEDLAHVGVLVASHDVVRIVFGIPFRLDGSAGPSAARAQAFLDALRAAFPAIPIEARDEALTSWEAEERMRDRGLDQAERKRWVDAYAAAVILQDDLDARARANPAPPREDEDPEE